MTWIFNCLSKVSFAIWLFLAVVRAALWLEFIIREPFKGKVLVLSSLLVYCLPPLLFVGYRRGKMLRLNNLFAMLLSVALLGLCEWLVSMATRPNPTNVILLQALVAVGMFLSNGRPSGRGGLGSGDMKA